MLLNGCIFLLLLLTSTLFHFILTHNSPFSTHTFPITARKPWPEAPRLVQHFSRSSLRGLLTRCIVTAGKHLLLYSQFIRNFFLHSHTHNYKPTLHPNHPIHPSTLFTLFLDTIRATQISKQDCLDRPGRYKYFALNGCSVQRSK